ncbi:hypothetical protein JNB63_02065 [Microbacterium trichothecenolyticum]|uniref:hypothetical protein n=1 Tax=Microbacterium trichothecenolyticum TaxID=69370 RepID=UPI001C6F4061|nr:hypothetical protein [Microbacterium trichothecenolyticum]MBW9118871.1 hypothetical protein [Microbacterium trichothecenolyticum]
MTDQQTPDPHGGILPELGRAVDTFINAWADAIRPIVEAWTIALHGYTVIENDLVPPGTPITDGTILYLHPIDVRLATGRFGDGIHGALDASLDWQLERIALAADRASARLDRMHPNGARDD